VATTKKKKRIVKELYCRYGEHMTPQKNFYSAVDKFLDKNGYFSVCKDCMGEIYSNFYAVEHDINRVIYKMCKALNVLYNDSAVETTKKMLAGKNMTEDNPSAWGIYKGKLPISVSAGLSKIEGTLGMSGDLAELTFEYATPMPKIEIPDDAFNDVVDVKAFWGDGFSVEDYRFLEGEYNNFKKTNKADTYPEIVLLREVCYKLLSMKNQRMEQKSTAVLAKELQELMKNLAISPSQLNAASAGKQMETFGQWIKDIENNKPADFFQDKSIYADIDDIEAYAEEHITRPLKNFITGSRDFGADDVGALSDSDEEGE